jgi:processive 1,2-diacylglycerol beta-glucosyltransferase/1,2-diacylglycerol 3-beta-galactosyltransferase
MFLYLKTGNGHLAPARALSESMKASCNNNIEIQLIDGLSDSPPLVRKIIEDGYSYSVNKALWIFESLYALNKILIISALTSRLVSLFIIKGIERTIVSQKPEKIVVFHFFLIEPVRMILQKHRLNIPVLTVVTDPYSAHPIWFLRKDQDFIVFSNELKENCIKKGIQPEKIRDFPFILNRKFDKANENDLKQVIRSKYGFRTDSRVVLLMGGGDGIPKGKKILKSIIKSDPDYELAMVCGKNSKLEEKAKRLVVKHGKGGIKIYGYIDFVNELITISDAVITKCGASSCMEILYLGKIPIINNYIWEQEKGNMEFIANGNMGIVERRVFFLPRVIKKLFSDTDYYNYLSENIRKAAISNGTSMVSDFIFNFKT